ncbi:unnamed protein product [Bursaphelenchus xylophilus]|uniref:(pine wood nematode) hypothetical protein n=1 Tax=Bursaphelenchus xylophilus TaxID=6326 RepID=A0A1I7SLD6_BURXY|nr:srab-57 [Bursaphelenchus xylophilus]CAD5234000.1 unnamed protein product [Bursaphelenchus xylophilus]CAG9129515.1 unnamed protein product [Bursaphelenchus xylophilus]
MEVIELMDAFNWTTVICATFVTAYFCFTVQRCKALHPNLRFFLIQIVLPLNFVGSTRLLGALNDKFEFFHHDGTYCRIVNFVNVFATALSDCTMLAIVAERCVATYNRKHYENQKSNMAKIFAVLMLIHGVCYNFVCGYLGSKVEATFPKKCMYLDRWPFLDSMSFIICAIFSIGPMPLVIYLYVYNKRLKEDRRALESLTTRYQLSENVLVLECLFYVFIICFGIHGNCGLITMEIAGYMSLFVESPDLWWINFLAHISHMFVDFVALTMELIFFYYHPVIRNRVSKDLAWLLPRVYPEEGVTTKNKDFALNENGNGEDYFNQLQDQWGHKLGS